MSGTVFSLRNLAASRNLLERIAPIDTLRNVQVHLHSSLVDSQGWNFHSSQPTLKLTCDATSRITTLYSHGGVESQWSDPPDALTWMSQNPGSPTARWIGYLSYDLGRLFESLPTLATDDLKLPLFQFALFEPGELLPASLFSPQQSTPLQCSLTKSQYLKIVEQALTYIRNGDVFQVNLSQRFTAPLTRSPEEIWNALPRAAYGAYLDFDDYALISNSPELFLHVTNEGQITTRPIKGTRPNTPGMEAELLASLKDQAELNMIIDLERNDLGRICQPGSVQVTQPRTIESHPTVLHGVATIQGTLQANTSFVDILRATFPGGSVTGAPKIRAMQIIEELEPIRRGQYCGAIGYLASDGSFQFNLAIRTMIARDNKIHIPVGGGIVADSDPQAEYEETLTKAVAMFRALQIEI